MSGTPTNAQTGFGSRLQRYDDSDANPTDISEVVDFNPSEKLDTADASTMNSPDGYKELVPTMKDAGSMTITLNWVPTDTVHQAIRADLRTAKKRKYRIITPTTPATNDDFYAYVTNSSTPFKHDGILVWNLTLSRTGSVVSS